MLTEKQMRSLLAYSNLQCAMVAAMFASSKVPEHVADFGKEEHATAMLNTAIDNIPDKDVRYIVNSDAEISYLMKDSLARLYKTLVSNFFGDSSYMSIDVDKPYLDYIKEESPKLEKLISLAEGVLTASENGISNILLKDIEKTLTKEEFDLFKSILDNRAKKY